MSYQSKRNTYLIGVGSSVRDLRCRAWVLAISLSLLMVMVGCHSSPTATTTTTPAATIALGAAPASLTVGQSYQFSATIANSTNTAITWSVNGVTGGNATVGTISSSGMFTAPAMMPSPASVTVMAASQADTSLTASASVAINLSLALNLSSASLQLTGTQQFTATILGSTNTAVTWTVNGVAGGNLTEGTISGTGLYTAPENPPSPNTVTVTATSVAENSMSASSTVTLLPPPITISVNPTALDLQAGHSVQFSDLVATTTAIPISSAVTWGVGSPGVAGNAVTGTISSTGTYTAPNRVPAFNPVKVYVVSQEDPTKSAIANVTVTTTSVPLQISTTTLANGVVNTPYSATISAFGGAQPYAWSISGGSLPAGLALSPSSGMVTGTPITAGISNFTVSVTDQSSTPQTQTANLSITIIPQLSITTTTLPSGSVGASYSATLAETGGVAPYTWSLASGALPSGLSLSLSTGAITGTPATGTGSATGQQYPITLKVTDSGTPQQTQTFSPTLIIYNGVAITTASPVNTAFVGQLYTFAVQAVGGVAPYTWLYTNLPSWLSVTPSTGLSSTLSGTPTSPASPTSFTVQITDANGVHNSMNLSIAVTTLLTFSAPTPPNGVVNTPYSTTLTAMGGLAPYTWTYTSLPTWLSAAASTGLSSALSGTPTTAGQNTFSAKVADSSVPPQTHSQSVSITTYSALTIITTSLPNGTVNSHYSVTLQSGGGTGTIAWTVPSNSLPAGLSLSASGTISGIPTSAATISFTVTATDSGTPQQTQHQLLSITVNPVLTITPPSLPSGTVGVAYSQTLQTSGGTPPITWSVTSGSLPPGLKLQGQGTSGASATISGTPTAAGQSTFVVTATDSSNPTVSVNTQSLSITINNVPLSIITTSLPNGTIGVTYPGAQLSASGGTGPYTWGLGGTGTFPPCFYLSSTGSITSGSTPGPIGSPCLAQTYTFGVTVTDSTLPTPQSKTATLSITINPAAAVACADSGSESLLSGQYAFSLSGYNPTGYLGVVGSFTADGTGKITAGEVDSSGALGTQSEISIDTVHSSYSVGPNHLGCASIVTSFGTFNTRLAVGGITSSVATAGRMIEWDAPGSSTYFAGTGQILQQTAPTATLSGSYVFAINGTDGSGIRQAMIGVMTASGGSFSSGEMDVNEGGTSSNGTGLAATYSSTDSSGRFTFTFTEPSGLAGISTVGYKVSAAQLLVIAGANASPSVGQMQLQSPPTGGFGAGSVNGSMVVFWTGLNGGGTGGSAQVGLVSAAGNGSMNITTYEDDAGIWNTPNPGSATCGYSIDSSGRMIFTSGGCEGALYLTAANTAFLLTPGSSVGFGQVLPQIVPEGGFTSTSFSSSYYFGETELVDYGVASAEQIEVTELTITAGSPTLIQDWTSSANGQQADETQSGGTLAVNSNGTFEAGGNGNINAIMISTSEFVAIDNSGSTYPIIMVAKH